MTIRKAAVRTAGILATGLMLSIFVGCATTPDESLQTRLSSMSDDALIGYYQGINDRLKAIQQGTREADREGTVLAQDQLARMPYIIGGEAFELEKKRERIRRELVRRDLPH